MTGTTATNKRRRSRTWNVLFLCTGNSCRSQMAEALLRHIGGTRFNARSAGTHPAGYIHPLAIETLKRMNVPLDGQRSKSWNEMRGKTHHLVITVCDAAASIPCPTWPKETVTVHWSLPDPTYAPGGDNEKLAAAMKVAEQLKRAIEALVALPLEELTSEQLKAELQRLIPA